MGLMGGNIEEAFRHLKGWYRVATKMQAKPCRQMMVGQMDEWVDLYRQRQSPGDPSPLMFLLSQSTTMHPPPANSVLRQPNYKMAELLVPLACMANP